MVSDQAPHPPLKIYHSKNATLTQCWISVGPASYTVEQHWHNIREMYSIVFVGILHFHQPCYPSKHTDAMWDQCWASVADNVGVIQYKFNDGPRGMVLYNCRCLSCEFYHRNIMFLPSQHWDIVVSMLCPWARHFTLKCFTSLRCYEYLVWQMGNSTNYETFTKKKSHKITKVTTAYGRYLIKFS